MSRILVVDDEAHIRELLSLYLRQEGYEVEEAQDGPAALELVRRSPPDLVILDIMLPGMDGWEVCRRLREISAVPVIMLTARDDEEDSIRGLDLGADDYVTKPFSPRQLLARVRAVLRRAGSANAEDQEVITVGRVRLDYRARELYVDGRRVDCTGKEMDLLWLFMSNPRRVFTRSELLERVWGYSAYVDERTVDVHVRKLRQKVEEDPSHPRLIVTVWGVGYKFAQGGDP